MRICTIIIKEELRKQLTPRRTNDFLTQTKLPGENNNNRNRKGGATYNVQKLRSPHTQKNINNNDNTLRMLITNNPDNPATVQINKRITENLKVLNRQQTY